jgi:hypothetical protein
MSVSHPFHNFKYSSANPHPVKMAHFTQAPIHTQANDHPNLIHHHISISLPAQTPTQLAFFSFATPPGEVRLHFWTQHAGFPTTALRFCTHLNYECTARYDGTPAFLMHSPEYVGAAQPSGIACGDPPTRFILELNRVVWEELQGPVIGLTALRTAVVAKIEEILKKGAGSNEAGGPDHNIALEDRAGGASEDTQEDNKPTTQGDVDQI